MARLLTLQLIETAELKGDGTEKAPYRRVQQLFSSDGTLLLQYDPHKDETTMTANLLTHLKWIA